MLYKIIKNTFFNIFLTGTALPRFYYVQPITVLRLTFGLWAASQVNCTPKDHFFQVNVQGLCDKLSNSFIFFQIQIDGQFIVQNMSTGVPTNYLDIGYWISMNILTAEFYQRFLSGFCHCVGFRFYTPYSPLNGPWYYMCGVPRAIQGTVQSIKLIWPRFFLNLTF